MTRGTQAFRTGYVRRSRRPSDNRSPFQPPTSSQLSAVSPCTSEFSSFQLPAFGVGRSALDVQRWTSALDVRCSSGIRRWMFNVRCWTFRSESSSRPPLHPNRASSSGDRAVGHPSIGIPGKLPRLSVPMSSEGISWSDCNDYADYSCRVDSRTNVGTCAKRCEKACW